MAFNQQTVVAIAHDAMGRELKRMLGNQLETEYRYDPQGRLAAQRTGKRGQDNKFAAITQRGYQYNAQGQLAQIDDQLRGTTRYHYDALDRLTQVDGPNPETFVHDPAGNILGKNESADTTNRQQSNGNRLAFYGDNHYTYDDRGNRILNAHGKNKSLQQRFTYNALNQLESVENQQQKTTYQYDALGRRISKRNATSETEFLWLDNSLLSETTTQLESRKQTAKIYLFEPGTHKPLAVVQDNEIYHYHLDHLGTPQEVTNSRGKLAWSASFKAYGNLAVVHNNDIENNLRFQGQYFDEETGLHYNRFRYYDPECGRFISQDPIGLLGGMNNYQYVPNPTGWIDPLGLSCKEGGSVKLIKLEDIKFKSMWDGDVYQFYVNGSNGEMLELAEMTRGDDPEDISFYIRNDFNRGVILKPVGFSLTEAVLSISILEFKGQNGVAPKNLSGSIIETNLFNYQSELVSNRNKNMPEEESKIDAVKNISFGKHRSNMGYDDFEVKHYGNVTVNKDNKGNSLDTPLENVPSGVKINAKLTNEEKLNKTTEKYIDVHKKAKDD